MLSYVAYNVGVTQPNVWCIYNTYRVALQVSKRFRGVIHRFISHTHTHTQRIFIRTPTNGFTLLKRDIDPQHIIYGVLLLLRRTAFS